MKNSALNYVWFTTFFLVIYTILCQFEIPYPVLITLFLIGHVLLLRMVYKVLKDAYVTKKTFLDWYEDLPVRRIYEEE